MMEVKFSEKYFKPNYPFVIRHHIWPLNIIVSFQVGICNCYIPDGKKGDYCIKCGFAIPSEKEKETFKLK